VAEDDGDRRLLIDDWQTLINESAAAVVLILAQVEPLDFS